MIKIAHVINPVVLNNTSDLFIAQPVTFKSFELAKANCGRSCEVQHFAAYYPEDETLVPETFKKLDILDRYVFELGNFQKQRKLPVLNDIIGRVYNQTDGFDLIIYTNVDIALQPHFYEWVANKYQSGIDAFVINRRTIPGKYISPEQLPEMYKEKGEKHPGFDCFVFKRNLYPEMKLGTACIGANWIGKVMISNLIGTADKFKIFKDEHLTFHIGDDRAWKKDPANLEYDNHNEEQLKAAIEHISATNKAPNSKILRQIIKAHYINKNKIVIPKDIIQLNTYSNGLNPSEQENVFPAIIDGKLKYILRQNPIFVTGFARSGTTLVQSLICTQDNIESFCESHYFWYVRPYLVVENNNIVQASLPLVYTKIRERTPFSTEAQKHATFLSSKGFLPPKALFEIIVADNLLKHVSVDEINSVQWVEKTPNHELFIQIILNWYSNAKIVHIVRNPVANIVSRRKYFNEGGMPIYEHGLLYNKSIHAAQEMQKKYPNRVKIIRYEDLIKDTKHWTEVIFKHLQVNFDLDKIDEAKNLATKYTLPWENWKSRNAKEISKQYNIKNKRQMSLKDIMLLKAVTFSTQLKYKYLTK